MPQYNLKEEPSASRDFDWVLVRFGGGRVAYVRNT